MSQIYIAHTIYKFFCFEIGIKTKADLYIPCEAMAHSPKSEGACGIVKNFNFQKFTV
jgi:hypothetical protein